MSKRVVVTLHNIFNDNTGPDSPDSTPPARALRSMQTGQNSLSVVTEKFAPQTIKPVFLEPSNPPASLGTSHSWHDPSFGDY